MGDGNALTTHKSDVIRTIAEQHDLSYAKSERIVQGVFDMITSSVSNSEKVSISKFGLFYKARAAAKNGKAPNGEPYSVEAKDVVKFRPFKELKDKVSQ